MKFQCSACKSSFRVTHFRLLFARKFGGIDPPTDTVAYYLKCPKCAKKSWLVPQQ